MSSVSCMAGQQSPLLPHEVSEFPIPDRPAKSRFRSLFSRKKSIHVPKEQAPALIEPLPTLPHNGPASRQPEGAMTQKMVRTRSTTWSKGTAKSISTKHGKQTRPRALTTWDPPPLFQAYTQAVMHAALNVPSSFGDVLFRHTQIRHDSMSSEAGSLDHQASKSSEKGDTTPENLVQKHKRERSSSSTCSLVEKVFVLVNSGYVLQYSAEGHPDRLPERILELGPSSVAIASDALPGKHWVLRISHDGKAADQLQTQTPKSSWSRLPFRSSETRRLVKDFLLVFGSAAAFDGWLTATRKEIEALGGLEYRPDSRGIDGELRLRRPTQRLKAQKTLPFSQSSSNLPLTPLEKEDVEAIPDGPRLLPPAASFSLSRKSTTSSSVDTKTDLDHLRGSSFDSSSIANTSNTTRTSMDDSTASGSPAVEVFPANLMPKPLAHFSATVAGSSKSVPTRQTSSRKLVAKLDARKSSSVDPNLLWSFQFPGDSSTPVERKPAPIGRARSDTINHDLFAQPGSAKSVLTPVQPTFPQSAKKEPEKEQSKTRPVSIIAPLPTPGALRRSGQRHGKDSPGQVEPGLTSPPARPASSHTLTSARDSSKPEAKRTPSYSLFPKRCSSLEYGQNSNPVLLSSPPLTGPAELGSMAGLATEGFPFPIVSTASGEKSKDPSPPSRPLSRMSHRKTLSISTEGHHHLRVDGKNKPERSPAVTEAHLATLFGTQAPIRRPQVEVTPEATDSSIATTTIEIPAPSLKPAFAVPVPNLTLPPRKERRLSPQKSAPNLLYSSVPPVGPPPSGPLPAVPTRMELNNPRMIKASHSKGKSSVSTVASLNSLKNSRTTTVRHSRGASSVSSAASVSSNVSASISPKKAQHARKLSSMSSVGSLGSVSTWVPALDSATLSPSPTSMPRLAVGGITPSPGALTPVTPTFPFDLQVTAPQKPGSRPRQHEVQVVTSPGSNAF